ncbi:MAG: septal ring lytic transglycosylase RlpA family protein [Treponema sp.]|nr:septal ring lytic transglycosylase RlpA family protein [Treponema sp.]
MKRFIFLLLIAAGIAAFSAAQNSGSEGELRPSAPAEGPESFRQEGIASWYGGEFDGKPTASGEFFNSSLFTAAHPTLPFGTVLTVTNKQNNHRVTVRINDRGPFVAARIIDLSKAAAEVLDMLSTGTAPVIVEKAVNTALGPAGEAVPTGVVSAVTPVPAPVVPSVPAAPPIVAPVPVAPSSIVTPAPDQAAVPAGTVAPAPTVASGAVATNELLQAIPQAATTPAPAVVAPAPVMAPVVPARATETVYPAPAAEIRGGIPAAGSTKLYRLQVGAYKIPRNAVEAFDKLKNSGLNPAYEKIGDFYRVVLPGLRAGEIQSITQKLGNAGFREAMIREE